MKNAVNLLVSVIFFASLILFADNHLNSAMAGTKKPKVIRIAMIEDLSGPYAPVLTGVHSAIMDACEYVNKELGGIEGVHVEPVIRDFGGKVDVAISAYMELIEMRPRPLTLGMLHSSTAEALKVRFAEDKIPSIVGTSTSSIYPVGYTFGRYPLYADMFGAFIDWMVENWDREKMGRGPRLAFLTWDTAYGRSVLIEECFAYARKKGVSIVGKELFGVRDMDVTTQLVRIRQKKPDWIYTNITSVGPAVIAKSAHSMGYNIKLANGLGNDWSAIKIAPKAMEGAINVMSFDSWDDHNSKGIKAVNRYFVDKKRKSSEKAAGYLLTWTYVLTAAEAIDRAVKEEGWKGLNGAAVRTQLEKMKDFSPLGLGYFTYTPKKHAPSRVYISQIKGGKIIPITGWRDCPDLRPDKFK